MENSQTPTTGTPPPLGEEASAPVITHPPAMTDPTQPGDEAYRQQLMNQTRACMESMLDLTEQGDQEAIMFFVSTLRDVLHALEEQWKVCPEDFELWASIAEAWPMAVHLKNSKRNESVKFVLEDLKLGSAPVQPLNLHGKSFGDHSPGTQVALHLYRILEACEAHPPFTAEEIGLIRCGLNPFCRATAYDWWKAAEPIFDRLYGTNFEEHPVFRTVFTSAVYTRQYPDAKKRRDRMRSDIKGLIRLGFRSISK